MQYTETTKQGYTNLFAKACIRPEHEHAIRAGVDKIIAHRAQYEAIERATDCPWWWVGITHIRESNGDFTTYLGNGEPLNRVTRLVPRNRGPFPDFVSGAIDALTYQGYAGLKDWSLPAALYRFEQFNGFGYVSHGINSPYLWSGTDLYQTGKFQETPAGSWFNPGLEDPQPGCAAMLQVLLALIPNLISGAIQMTQPTPAPSPTVTVPATASNVVVNPLVQVGLNLLSSLGAIFASSHVDVGGIITTLSGGSFWGGILAFVVPQLIGHYITKTSNAATIAALSGPNAPAPAQA